MSVWVRAVVLNTSNFEHEVLKSSQPVLVDFWAGWCAPCKMLSPIIDQIAEEYTDVLKVGKLDIDESQDIAVKFGIMSIPTLKAFAEV